jgi:hypothetical protein
MELLNVRAMISLAFALLGAAAVYGTDVFFCVVGRTALSRVRELRSDQRSSAASTMGQRDRRAGTPHGLRGGRARCCTCPVGAVRRR